MKIFLSHSKADKESVRAIARRLMSNDYEVWLDEWSMTPGDSLIEKIGDGIFTSDKLVVFLTPNSVESNWVKKEVATGLVLEIAKAKGADEKFVIPCKLAACNIPIMLIDKIYADFTNKRFEEGCDELLRGILNKGKDIDLNEKFENRFSRISQANPKGNGKHAVVIEFGVKVFPSNGITIDVDAGSHFVDRKFWMGRPNVPHLEGNFGAFNFSINERPPLISIRFSQPIITTALSFYLYLESNAPFNIQPMNFLDYNGEIP